MSGLDELGFDVVADVVPAAARSPLLAAFDEVVGERPGQRQGLAHAAVRTLACSPAVRALVEPVLGRSAFAFRATLFDKTPAANWWVGWHQDRTVPVQQRVDLPGYGPWSTKDGGWFVEPPAAVLAGLLAVRIDLDGSSPDNGALWVVPGTHRAGVLSPTAIATLVAGGSPPALCGVVPVGGALRMRPLLLHRSGRGERPGHRRIVHLEFAAAEASERLPFAACVR